MIGLRFSNVMEPDDYLAFPSYNDDAQLRRWNLWGYIDARDAPRPCAEPWPIPAVGPTFSSLPTPTR